jgi:citrate lyase subunit beta/citryl-CoA lyase
MKALRSLLSTPANRPRMLEKALTCGADAVVVDLEDSVPAAEKPRGRALTRELIADRGADAVVYVRVNPIDSEHVAEDVAAVVAPGLVGVQLPKVSGPEDVLRLGELLDAAEAAAGMANGSVEILVSIESALAVVQAYDILSASPRVGSAMPGVAENGDLQRELGYEHTPDEIGLFHTRASVLVAARAAGITNPIDGVYGRVDDDDGFVASATIARRLGYRGKKVIHPRHARLANQVFMPSEAELDFHRRVLDALAEAEQRGSAATVVDGAMVDTAMAATARQALAWAADGRAP